MRTERFTREALRALGGLLAWAAHLAVLYGFVGLACARDYAPLVPGVIAAATALALVACALLLASAWRRDGDPMLGWLTGATALAGTVAIVWEAIPVLMVPICG
jgi:hypothetical protein